MKPQDPSWPSQQPSSEVSSQSITMKPKYERRFYFPSLCDATQQSSLRFKDPLLCETIVAGVIFEKQSKGKTARERTGGVEDGFPRVRLHKICHFAMVVYASQRHG